MEVISSIYNSGYNIKKFYLGSRELNLAYLGNQVIYDEVIGDNDFNYILYEFYGSDTLPNTVEAPVKSAILKGQTFVNLSKTSMVNLENGRMQDIELNMNLEVGKSYTLITNISNNDETGVTLYGTTSSGQLALLVIKGNGLSKLLIEASKIKNNVSKLRMQISATDYANGKRGLFENIMIIEGDYTNVDIPYFEGMQSVKMPVLTTTGKNLLPKINFVYNKNLSEGTGVITDVTNDNWAAYEFVSIPKNKTSLYTNMGHLGIGLPRVVFYNENKEFISSVWRKDELVIPTGAKYLRMGFVAPNNDSNKELINKIMLCETKEDAYSGYEPFKSNILTVNEDVTLRSNGDVYDELNLLTGRLTQRIDENNEVLAQAVVKTVDLTIVDQDGKTINKLNSFNGTTHVSTEVAENSAYPMVSLEVASELQAAMSKVTEDIELIKPVQNDIETTIDTQSNDIDSLLLATTELFEMFL